MYSGFTLIFILVRELSVEIPVEIFAGVHLEKV